MVDSSYGSVALQAAAWEQAGRPWGCASPQICMTNACEQPTSSPISPTHYNNRHNTPSPKFFNEQNSWSP